MRTWIGILCWLWGICAGASEVELFTPQGTAKGLRQAAAKFSQPVVALGDARAADPFEVNCPVAGSGKWLDGRTWVYDFERDLPGAVRCEFKTQPGLKDTAGGAVQPASFRFDTGGPQGVATRPADGSEAIDERQAFLLVFDAQVLPGTLTGKAWCQVKGLAERIEVEVLQGAARDQVLQPLKATNDPLFRRRFAPNAGTTEVLRCKRPLPNDAQVSLILERGIEAGNGLKSAEMQTFTYQVRPAFRARVLCDKVNPRSACNPLMPLRLYFGGQVAWADAKRIRLTTPDGRGFVPKAEDEPDSGGRRVESLRFDGPFPEKSTLTLTLPPALRDDAGRALLNAASFPLALKTDEVPPLAKFPAGFGIIEAAQPVLPVSLRNLETTANALVTPGRMAAVREGADSMIIGWLKYLEEVRYGRRVAGKDKSKPAALQPEGSFSVLEGVQPLVEFALPKPNGDKAFEVVGLPLAGPGFYVVELASPKLGAAYLDGKTPYHTHTAALVTNLVAHFKAGRESSLVWVTALDSGQPVAHAAVAVSDCDGKVTWQGATDDQGRARIAQSLGEAKRCKNWPGGWFVSAKLGRDRTFTLSSWNDGIESWRFHMPSAEVWTPEIAHTVLDRSLFRAGETVAMKHFVRLHSGSGLALVAGKVLPKKLTLTHVGSGQSYSLPVEFDRSGIAESSWTIPPEAKLGVYEITLGEGDRARQSGRFNVAAFRLPTLRAQIGLPSGALVRAREADIDVAVSYLSGGGASLQPVKLRSLIEPAHFSSEAWPNTQFANGNVQEGLTKSEDFYDGFNEFDAGAEEANDAEPRAAASTQAATLDKSGAARIRVGKLPLSDRVQNLRLELEYRDASGETQTVSRIARLWPGRWLPGIRIDDWNTGRDALRYKIAVIDVDGRAVANARVESDIFVARTYSHRKRLIGGFYAYENMREVKRLASGCGGQTDSNGWLACEMKPPAPGNLVIRAKVADADGNVAYAHGELWVAGSDETWFAGSDSDRMDVLPEKPRYEPGETAELQVRMPFRAATALVTVEREGVLDSFVVPLTGKSPTVRVPVKPDYAPNVVVSVLAVRGRVDGVAPAALIDLGKPAYKLGAASLRVGERGHRLEVAVRTPQTVYKIRDKVPVTIKVNRADGGKLPANAEVALAAVDESLLELAPNSSWKLLDAMMATRPWEVETSTAQMQVVGKRHFGRKALPPGGGGGKLPTRELFDTRVLWQARVRLDAAGTARVDVPLNDSLTSFRIVAVANAGTGFFGDGGTSVQTRQEVMLLAGLPPVVREGDVFQASFSVRNGGDQAQTVKVAPALSTSQGKPLALESKTVELAPGQAQEITWQVSVPNDTNTLDWKVSARAAASGDEIKTRQQVLPAVPVRVGQATLLQLDGAQSLTVERPVDAIPGRGGVVIAASATLAGNLSAMREYMRAYPYICMEQRVSRALALNDAELWADAMSRLPAHLDDSGLAKYFATDWLRGDEVLTAYILSSAHAAHWTLPSEARDRMIEGLKQFVAGRGGRSGVGFADGNLRRLAAIEALARYDQATPDMLDAIELTPNTWPTSGVIDWISILQKLGSIPEREARLQQALGILRARMDLRGTTLNGSSGARDDLWWLMVSPDLNAARSLAVLLEAPEMQSELPRLARGLMARQKYGRWDLTTANAWARIALEQFSQRFESAPVSGVTRVEMAGTQRAIDWKTPLQSMELPWPSSKGELKLVQQGSGKPWITVTSRAAVPLKAARYSGYTVARRITPVQQTETLRWHRGDLARVTLEIDAQADMSWVVVNDPLPAGATVLGGGLQRDSTIMNRGNRATGSAWPAFEERGFDSYRAYYAWVPKGKFTLEYVVRLNTPGQFRLPPTRIEAMYQPEQFGEVPNAAWDVMP